MIINHEKTREIDIPKNIVFENFLDLDHINFVHKKCYKYCNLVKRTKNYMLLDVGVYHIPGIPFVSHYTMFHEVVSQNKIIHFSKRKNSSKYVKSEVNFIELSEDKTKIVHKHSFYLPIIFYPFRNIILKIVDKWSNILWLEDSKIMKQRLKVLSVGFKDGFHCGKWILDDGRPTWVYNNKK
jgi:hypothetical protein